MMKYTFVNFIINDYIIIIQIDVYNVYDVYALCVVLDWI